MWDNNGCALAKGKAHPIKQHELLSASVPVEKQATVPVTKIEYYAANTTCFLHDIKKKNILYNCLRKRFWSFIHLYTFKLYTPLYAKKMSSECVLFL